LRIAGPDSRMVSVGYKASRGPKAVSVAKGGLRKKRTRGKAKKASH
jgi:hypothetical protein